jgi:hypothetical protein
MANGVRISNGVKLLKGIEAKVTELTFDSKVMVAVEQKTVKPPHWKEGEKVEYKVKYYKMKGDDTCSKKPAVYTIPDSKNGYYAHVTVNVTKLERVSGKATLLGNLGGMKMQGEFPLKKGVTIVKVKLENPRKGIQWYKGVISWQLKVQGQPGANVLNGTFAEVFFILDTPKDFYVSGVWVEALRFLCKRAVIINVKDAKTATDRITRYCHGPKHGLKYDITYGAPKYGIDNGKYGVFKLKGYLVRQPGIANCFDQGAAVQSLCGAVGISLLWIYMRPFGFINTTNLLGYGKCNNPFLLGIEILDDKIKIADKELTDFEKSADLKKPTSINKLNELKKKKDKFQNERNKRLNELYLPDINDKIRQPFGCHVFCDLDVDKKKAGMIYDACAGPHTGDTRVKYVKDSIDAKTSLYYIYGISPGTVKNMQDFHSGVIGVE